MKKNFFLILNLCFFANTFAQSYSVSGYVRDSASSETIVGAMIYEPTTKNVTISNEYGYYSIQLPQGFYSLECSSLGSNTKTEKTQVKGNTRINFKLSSLSFEIENVIVYAQQHSSEVITKRLSAKQIEMTPSTFGVPDVIKVIQTQPSVKTIGYATSAMYVRGGNRDQDMIRIDEANIYNVSHMYGYVSTFNPDMINDVSFYNSYFSPEFGGRLSSVLDAQMKEENLNKYSGSALLSVLTANASAEGTIKKDVASFFIAGRRSTLDIIKEYADFEIDVPTFYDLNAKINYKINNKNRVFLSSYLSSDYQKYPQLENRALNVSGTARWISELQLNALWAFTSGRPGTFPYGFYFDVEHPYQPKIPLYNERNSDSYPAYHRLDISLVFNGKQHEHFSQSFTIGVYNAYCHKNILYYDFDAYSLDHGKFMANAYYFRAFAPNFTYKVTFK